MESGGGGGMDDTGEIRRRLSSEERTYSSSNNLRDLLRFKDENTNSNDSNQIITLSAVLTSERRPLNRTLLDIIRDDPNVNNDHKKSWKHFRDKLRLRRAVAAWTSTIQIPTSDVPINQQNNSGNRMVTWRHSTRIQNPTVLNTDESTPSVLMSSTSNRAMSLRRNSSFVPERQISSRLNNNRVENNEAEYAAEVVSNEQEVQGEAEEGVGETDGITVEQGGGEGGPVRMSLMALLAETDRQMGIDGSAYLMDDDEEEAAEEEMEIESGGVNSCSVGGGEYNNCCVCMVRHKGAAFIPCGHTFCRLCCRELWVQRGNCPLCNGFILEILDIF